MSNKDNKLIYEAWDAPGGRPAERGMGSDGNGWSSEGLEELKPHELVEFINDALPKFLQTHFDPEAYDDVHKSLYRAAYTINWEMGPEDGDTSEELPPS